MRTPIEKNVGVWVPWRNITRRTRLRLLCLPYAGGSASAFRNWSAALPEGIEICPVELAGRGNRFQEAPCRDLGRLVRDLSNELRPLLDVPFAIFGHSMGALLTYLLALRLRKENLPGPVQLFLSGRRAAHLACRVRSFHNATDPELLRHLQALNGIPEEIFKSAGLLSMILPIFRADLELIDAYTHQNQPPLDCSICALAGIEDPFTTIEEVQAWRAHTAPGKFSFYSLPGDHFFLKRPEFMSTMCGRLEQLLQQL
jgi:medium-chain acyl-[acyl-carrier-protein] hydrolase